MQMVRTIGFRLSMERISRGKRIRRCLQGKQAFSKSTVRRCYMNILHIPIEGRDAELADARLCAR